MKTILFISLALITFIFLSCKITDTKNQEICYPCKCDREKYYTGYCGQCCESLRQYNLQKRREKHEQ